MLLLPGMHTPGDLLLMADDVAQACEALFWGASMAAGAGYAGAFLLFAVACAYYTQLWCRFQL